MTLVTIIEIKCVHCTYDVRDMDRMSGDTYKLAEQDIGKLVGKYPANVDREGLNYTRECVY